MDAIITRFAHLFFKIYSTAIVRDFVNRGARRLHRINPLPLNTAQERVVHYLKQDGIAVTQIDELFPGKNMLMQLREYTEKRMVSAEAKTAKQFLRQLWDAVPVFTASDPFMRLATEERVQGIVNSYLSLYAKLYYFTLNATVPVNDGSAAVQSQRWHRDPEDRNMCKIFLYLNDVDETAGPFFYVRGSQWGGRFGHLFPQNPPRGSYPPEAEVLRGIPQKEMFMATGKAGTIIFCDTAGIHKGGYATKNMRLMFTAGYRSPASPWPVRYKLTEDAKKEISAMRLAEPVRYALDSRPPALPFYFLKKIKKNFTDYA
ncbi:MAG: phytanoyl-CoA dioxygenase family protein [Candidatus Sungbacteria bacterium]|nr:phytanoyl-CoA dioxygenase family protein [Candidatus Sungbacteria bacterium]